MTSGVPQTAADRKLLFAGSHRLAKVWKRINLELQPVVMFCAVFAGKALVDIAKQVCTKTIPRYFGNRQRAWQTIRYCSTPTDTAAL